MSRAVRSSGRVIPIEVWAFLIALVAAVVTLVILSAQGSGLVAAYAFSEGIGTEADDHSGHGNAAMLVNGAARTASGRYGGGLVLDDASEQEAGQRQTGQRQTGQRQTGQQGVVLPLTSSLSLTDAFTLEAWVLPFALGTAQQVVGLAADYPYDGVTIYEDGRPGFDASFTSGWVGIRGLNPLPAGEWSHLAVTYDGATVSLYVDGGLVAATPRTGSLLADSAQALWLGRVRIGVRPLNGGLDEVRIYNRGLTATQVRLDAATPVDAAAAFTVTVQSPRNDALGVVGNTAGNTVRATFAQPADPNTVSAFTFELRDSSQTPVYGAVTYSPATRTATFTPDLPLASGQSYVATIAGGTGGIQREADGADLPGDVVWTFTTATGTEPPRASYPFSEGSGSTTSDVSGNGNDAALVNAPAWTASGKHGGGLVFDPELSPGVRIPLSDTLALPGAFTMALWINRTQAVAQQLIAVPSDYPYDGLLLDSHGALGFSAVFSDGYVWVSSSLAVPLHEWTHVAVSYDGSHVRLYFNGLEMANRAATGHLLFWLDAPYWIGRGSNGLHPFAGSLDELHIYNRALPGEELAESMALPADPSAPFTVTSTTPATGAVGVVNRTVEATFAQPATSATLTAGTFRLHDDAANVDVAGTVTYVPATQTATFTSPSPLVAGATYTATIVGGSGGVQRDADDADLPSDVVWTFTMANASAFPRAAYPFSEGSGTITADVTGHGNDGTLVNAPAWTAGGRFGSGLAFDGMGAHGVGMPRSDTLALPGAFTVEKWVKRTQEADQFLLAVPSDYPYNGLMISSQGSVGFSAAFTDGEAWLGSSPTLALNAWTHVALTYESGYLRLYLDGTEVASTPRTGSIVVWPGAQFWLGRAHNGGRPFAGVLDEVRIYDRALAAIEVGVDMATSIEDLIPIDPPPAPSPCVIAVSPASAMAEAAGGSGTVAVLAPSECAWTAETSTSWLAINSTVAGYAGRVLADGAAGYWRMDEFEGTVLHDQSGRGRNGRAQQTPAYGLAGATADGNTAMGLASAAVTFADGVGLFAGPTSIEFWLRVDEGGYGSIAIGSGWQVMLEGSRVRFFSMVNEFSRFDVTSNEPLSDGAWHHVVAVYAPVDQEVRVFVDGLLDVSGALLAGLSGTRPLDGLGPAGAAVDEVAVYQSALTAEQAAAHYLLRLSPNGGAGQVVFTASPNPLYESRVGAFTIGAIPVTITQEAHPCYEVSPDAIDAASGGAAGVLTLTALAPGCSWTASANVPWVTLGTSSGSASADVAYTVAPNPYGTRRSAVVTIAGASVAVHQAEGTLHRPSLRYAVAAGRSHTLALQDNGTVWSWGRNNWAQLGDGTATDRYLPVHLTTPTNVVGLAAGDAHSLALTATGTLWAWGANGVGQLGSGTVQFRYTPAQVSNLADVVAVAAGADHSIALKADGTVWAWGRNTAGQLGDGTTVNRTLPKRVTGVPAAAAVAASAWRSLVVDIEGALWVFGDGVSTPARVATGPVVAAAGGMFGITAAGQIWAWGNNSRGRLGDGTVVDRVLPVLLPTIDGVAQLATGGGHAIAVRSDGSVWSWGGDDRGQLGQGTAACPATSHTFFDGQYSATPAPVAGLAGVAHVSAGGSHTVLVAADGEVWTWGANDERQLGDGSPLGASLPLKIADAGFTWHTGTPILTGGGKFSNPYEVMAASLTAGAVIHYTVDGTEPTEADPMMPLAPQTMWIAQTTVLTARAFSAGRPPSRVVSETYAFVVPRPGISPPGGTYSSAQSVTMTGSGSGVTVRYTLDGTDPTGASSAYSVPITIDSSTTLKVRAFKDGWTPSELTSLSYRMNFGELAAPTISPSGGHHPFGTSITIAANPVATIHYTMDGSLPSVFSPVYLGAFALTGPLTLRAAAFHDDWTRSAVATVALDVAEDVPSCEASVAPAALVVAAAAASGDLAVTLDPGCERAASVDVAWIAVPAGVAQGSGAVAYTVEANTTGVPRTATITVAGSRVLVSQAAADGLTIAGAVSPPPNAAGWNRGPVTVLFACAGGGTITCPVPAQRSSDGEHDVIGQATNDLGASASTTVRVRVDATPPFIAIASPAAGELVTPGPVIVTGTAADVLSSVSAVTCDGQPAVLTGFQFSCTVLVEPGTSTIAVRATDTASNLRVATLTLSTAGVVGTRPPTSLRITPDEATMLAGQIRGFRVTDNLGRVPADAEWTTDNPAMATVSVAQGVA